jgi:hypothetical protein
VRKREGVATNAIPNLDGIPEIFCATFLSRLPKGYLRKKRLSNFTALSAFKCCSASKKTGLWISVEELEPRLQTVPPAFVFLEFSSGRGTRSDKTKKETDCNVLKQKKWNICCTRGMKGLLWAPS